MLFMCTLRHPRLTTERWNAHFFKKVLALCIRIICQKNELIHISHSSAKIWKKLVFIKQNAKKNFISLEKKS